MPAVVDWRFPPELVAVALVPTRSVTTAIPMIAVAASTSMSVEPRSPRARRNPAAVRRGISSTRITRIRLGRRHRVGGRSDTVGRLDLLRMRRAGERVLVGDEAVHDQVVEPRLERAH